MANKDTSKQWFETGDYPTQAQFAQVFEWLRWKDEALAVGDVTGLQAILNNLSAAPVETYIVGGGWNNIYTVPAGYLLEKIVVVPVADCNPYLNYAAGGAIIVPVDLDNVLNSAGAVWVVNVFADTPKNIEISNMPVGSSVYFIKKKIV